MTSTDELTSEAVTRLIVTLMERGNKLSPEHQTALNQMVRGMAEQALGAKSGRWVYGLPCGAGKTTAIVALIAAAEQLRLGLSFAIVAAKVEALCELKRDLVAAGVRVDRIALHHSYLGPDDLPVAGRERASEPSDGNADRPISLGTHVRIRAGNVPAFCLHRGEVRSLIIYDETLLRSETKQMRIEEVREVFTALHDRAQPGDPVAAWLRGLHRQLAKELERQTAGRKPKLLTDLLPDMATDDIVAHAQGVLSRSRVGSAALRTIRELVELVSEPVSVAIAEQGSGMIHYAVAVDPALKNIAVLDASHAVRLLAQADRTLHRGMARRLETFKDYSNVTLYRRRSGGGRSTVASSQADVERAASGLADAILAAPPSEGVLIFTYKKQDGGTVDPQAITQDVLRASGVDLAATVTDPVVPSRTIPRVQFATWGSATSTNEYSHAKHVFLVGVYRVPPLVTKSALAGQVDDPLHRAGIEEFRAIENAELAHQIMQALNRGNARITENGTARPMTVYAIFKENAVEDLLREAMPGLVIEPWGDAPQPRTRPRRAPVGEQLQQQFAEGLAELEVAGITDISISEFKKQMTLAGNVNTQSQALRSAIEGTPWSIEGRSLTRQVRPA